MRLVDLVDLDTSRCFPAYSELDDRRVVVHALDDSNTACDHSLFAIWRLHAPGNGSSRRAIAFLLLRKPQI
jgi:hypothetical protein